MIIIRNVFQIEFGAMGEAKRVALAGKELAQRLDFPVPRLLTDVTGAFYTLIMETEFESLGDFEQRLQRNFQDSEWQAWFREFSKHIRSGSREVYRTVE